MSQNSDALARIAELRQVERLGGILKVDASALIEWVGGYQLVRDMQIIEDALNALPALLDIALSLLETGGRRNGGDLCWCGTHDDAHHADYCQRARSAIKRLEGTR